MMNKHIILRRTSNLKVEYYKKMGKENKDNNVITPIQSLHEMMVFVVTSC